MLERFKQSQVSLQRAPFVHHNFRRPPECDPAEDREPFLHTGRQWPTRERLVDGLDQQQHDAEHRKSQQKTAPPETPHLSESSSRLFPTEGEMPPEHLLEPARPGDLTLRQIDHDCYASRVPRHPQLVENELFGLLVQSF